MVRGDRPPAVAAEGACCVAPDGRSGRVRQGDRLAFVPPSSWGPALQRPVTRRLLVTAAGFFPVARGHVCHRPQGIGEAVFIVCTDGRGWLRMGATSHRVAPSQALVLPAGHRYSYGADLDDPWTIWWCHLRGSDLNDLFATAGATPARPVLSLRYGELVVADLDGILTGLARDHTPARLVGTSGLAWRMFTQIAADKAAPEAGDPVQRAMTYLNERYAAQITVAELAHMVGVSASHLTALFRVSTGGGALVYQTSVRMARARELLDATDLSVAQIAERVGYEDPFYFSRRFKKVHHVSPSQYRQRTKA